MPNSLIYNSSSGYGAGIPSQHKLFRVPIGEFSDRIFALFPKSASVIAYSIADPPYVDWSTPVEIITDAADYPVAGWMDDEGNVFVAWTRQTTGNLMSVKLSYAAGAWSLNTEATVYSQDDNYFPALYKDRNGTLLITWSRYSGGAYYLNAKVSVNEGDLWGVGPTDPGEALISTGATSAYSLLVNRQDYLHCFYTLNGTTLAKQQKDISSVTWGSAETIYTGTGLYDNFGAAVSLDHRLAVAFSTGDDLYYKEHDGTAWSGLYTVDADPAFSPKVYFIGTTAYVLFGREVGTNQVGWYSAHLEDSVFTTPAPVMPGYSIYDAVYCYAPASTPALHEVTDEAADESTADIFHADTGKLIAASGDAVYLGMADHFCRAAVILSTTGVGGAVAWSYWDGSSWAEFTPASGAYHFDSSPSVVRLWDDLDSAPSDWQKTTVGTQFCYWVRATVGTAFSTAPIGGQLTAVANLDDATIAPS